MRPIHIILSCTARKHGAQPADPRLRGIPPGPVSDRAAAWAALAAEAPKRLSVAGLYAGERWQAGLGLVADAERATAGPVGVSVVSAGLGLVGLGDMAPCYGATFAAGHPDSVLASPGAGTARSVRRRWWDEITHAVVIRTAGPQRIADIGGGGTVIVCLGQDYLDAVAADLAALAERSEHPGRVIVFGSGEPRAGLEQSWAPAPGRVRALLGGPMTSANIRAARAVLRKLGGPPPGAAEARDVMERLAAESAELPRPGRTRDDRMILSWIRDRLEETPRMSKTAALKAFRGEGEACGHARFGRLFEQA